MATPSRAFDDVRPPEPELLDACGHCGFCLPTCPTYVLWGEEMDSPRGRIALMKQGLEEGSVLDDDTVLHVDRCLGCMACVTACPSGVQYDRLIEDTPARGVPAAGPRRAPSCAPCSRTRGGGARSPRSCRSRGWPAACRGCGAWPR